MKTSLITVVAFSLALAFAQDNAKPQRIGGNVMQSKIASRVTPAYPALAKQQGVEGTVRFEATIDKDGHVSALSVVSGPPLLIQSAVDAVKQWVYDPTLLNGEPVSVVTTIDVNYTLTQ
jgi:protein TonB